MAQSDNIGDISVIKIRGVGTVLKGLNALFLQASRKSLTGKDLEDFLINGLKQLNTISKNDEAFLRELLPAKFQRFLDGKPEPEEESPKVDIKILGSCCHNSQILEKNAMQAVLDLGVDGPFLMVSDAEKIAEFGLIRTPCLVINGRVRSQGRVVSVDEIKKMILEETGGSKNGG
jgi:small redox-active disulfide protein 2